MEDQSQLEELKALLSQTQTQLEKKSRELTDAQLSSNNAQEEAEAQRRRADGLENELRTCKLEAEVEKLRELETLRRKFDAEREQLREDRAQDGVRFVEWKAAMTSEKEKLEEQVQQLKGQLEKSQSESQPSSKEGGGGGHSPDEPDHTPEEPARSGSGDHSHSSDGDHAHREPTHTDGSRSEERRVGKECRSRWSPYH